MQHSKKEKKAVFFESVKLYQFLKTNTVLLYTKHIKNWIVLLFY